MGLKKYRAKRNLKESHEPIPKQYKKKSSDALSFCIQKHAARRLHYDFRLEHHGVLVSWVIPKGPSLDPQDKRLAIKVEDHPLEYQFFEGTIPKGNYGAGTVEIWDKGFYTIPNSKNRKEAEKIFAEGLRKGHFIIDMHGEKINGLFVFKKMKQSEEDASWLVFKKEDFFAQSPTKVQSAKKTKMPEFISPMLATLISRPFDSDDWLFEIKWDGYRTLAFVNHDHISLKSRNKHLLNQRFPTIVAGLKPIHSEMILDGEIVVVDNEGKPHFQLLQNYQKNKEGNLVYYVFDILYKDGEDLRSLALIERKQILKQILQDLSSPQILFSDYVVKEGISFFDEVLKMDLEGIIGKNIASTYQSRRSQEWVKIKTSLRQEVVIGGFTEPRGSRKKFGSLLVGIYNDQKEFVYVGHVGSGFDSKLLKTIFDLLFPLVQKECPFTTIPKSNSPVKWVKPKLVCEVSFSEWTLDHIMRHPVFQRLREDKAPKTVQREVITPPPVSILSSSSNKNEELSLTNLEKIYWPEENYTKGDLLNYYENIAPFILPYLKNRPITLHRFPEGINGNEFYQKDLNNKPNWVKTYPVQQEGKIINYLCIEDIRSLLYAINLGSIDLHPFLSHYQNLSHPDYCVIDLDPLDIPFEKVIETALATNEILNELNIPNYCKTSGIKGLHLLIPLHAKYTYEQSRQFAEIIAHCVHNRLPKFTSLERNPEKRKKRVYLDYLQNREKQTIVAPYCVRPRPHALVSTPLAWEEVPNLNPSEFNLKTIPNRLKDLGDIFKPILGSGINIKVALTKLSKILAD